MTDGILKQLFSGATQPITNSRFTLFYRIYTNSISFDPYLLFFPKDENLGLNGSPVLRRGRGEGVKTGFVNYRNLQKYTRVRS